MRLENVKNWSLLLKGIGGPSMTIEMEYFRNLSVNYYRTKDGRVKSDVKQWRDELAFIIKANMNAQDLEFKTPLKVRVDGQFKDKRSMPDLHNLLKVVCDAVEKGLGIDDRQYFTETGQPEVGPEPKVIVAISGEVEV